MWPSEILLWTTVLLSRWVQRYAPELNRRVTARAETHLRVPGGWVAGRWTYLNRAVVSTPTIGFYLSEQRNAAAAKHFFGKALAPRIVLARA